MRITKKSDYKRRFTKQMKRRMSQKEKENKRDDEEKDEDNKRGQRQIKNGQNLMNVLYI